MIRAAMHCKATLCYAWLGPNCRAPGPTIPGIILQAIGALGPYTKENLPLDSGP